MALGTGRISYQVVLIFRGPHPFYAQMNQVYYKVGGDLD